MSFRKFAEVLNRRRYSVSAAFLILTLIASFFVVKLYANLKPDIEELLPTSSRSVKDLNEVTERLRSIDNLAILLFSNNAKELGRFQEDLAQALIRLPVDVSAGVEYKISDELEFFEKRKSLFISTNDLKEVRDFVKEKIKYEKFLYNPVNLIIEDKPLEPEYDFMRLEGKYSSQSKDYAHFPGGIYATPEGTKRLILIYSPNQSITTAHVLKDAVKKAIASLHPESYAKDLKVSYSGNVQDIIEEQAALLDDLVLSTGLVTILVSLLLWLYFRSLFATVALIASLMVGTLITFGVAYFKVGYLNANSAFLGSIVMGNGINFGIMILARYLEERRAHKREHIDALCLSLRETWLATLTAALAAGLAYGSLLFTSFRGFSQFGVIGLIGMASCWICAYTFFPAFLSVINGWVNIVGKDRRVESRAFWSRGIEVLLRKCAWPVAIFGILITLTAIYGVTRIDSSILETDLTKLRDKHSMEEGSGYLTRYVDLILKRYSSPIAVLAHNPTEAKQVADNLKKKKAEEGKSSLIESVMQVQDFVPPDQAEKIKILKSIRELLPPKLMWSIAPDEKKRVLEFTSTANLTPFQVDDLPPKLLERFREKNGSVGNLVLVEPPMTDEIRHGKPLIHFVKSIRDSVDQVGAGIPVAGRLPVSADMIEAIVREGPVATLISALSVIFLTLVIFRNLELSVLVLGSLFMGVTWMIGIMVLCHLKINFLNFIALPITFGIGVDYAVNVFARFREEKQRTDTKRAMIRSAYHTGGAVVLASCTTIIGWGSLLIAGNQAFVSFGKLAVLGEVTCVSVAVLVMPALLILLRQDKTES
jgi:predicted RND superfamily exporter protein